MLRNKIKTLNKENIKVEMAIYDVKSQNKELIEALKFYCHTSSDINWKAMQTLKECGINWQTKSPLN
jgi:hypothetical protein